MTDSRTGSRKALRELIDFLSEADERWAGPEWNLQSESDVVNAHRALMHMLEAGLLTYFEHEPEHPRFRKIVSPTRKLTGDNPDAIYYDAPIRDDLAYRVRGRVDGAVYVSFTIEVDTHDGRMAQKTGGVLNDTQFDVDGDSRFELFFGGEPQERNWLALPPGASRITTRHYYENETSAAADPGRHAALEIEPIVAIPAPAAPGDASVAAGIRRVVAFVRSRTLDQRPMAEGEPPPFVSIVPNVFPAPVAPGAFGLAAFDAAYSMAPFLLGPDDALLISGRWPSCRCANVALWNRHMQTFDYANRQISRNRAQTTLLPDGSFRMILAHRDPGLPNWIDTAGQAFGLVFWRFMLPEGPIETPQAELVPFASMAGGE